MIEISLTDADAIALWLEWASKNHPDSAARLSARVHAEELREKVENCFWNSVDADNAKARRFE